MEYIIVTGDSVETLQEVVMYYIKDDFKPCAGPFVTKIDRGMPSEFAQAMTK